MCERVWRVKRSQYFSCWSITSNHATVYTFNFSRTFCSSITAQEKMKSATATRQIKSTSTTDDEKTVQVYLNACLNQSVYNRIQFHWKSGSLCKDSVMASCWHYVTNSMGYNREKTAAPVNNSTTFTNSHTCTHFSVTLLQLFTSFHSISLVKNLCSQSEHVTSLLPPAVSLLPARDHTRL